MALLGTALVGLVLRLAYVAAVGPRIKLGLDSIWYTLVARTLATSHVYVDPVLLFHGVTKPTANFPPLYPTFLATLYRLGITTPKSYQVVGAFCGAATVVLTGLLGRRVSGRPVVGVAAAGLVAVSPVLIATDASVMSETVAVPISVAVLLAATWAAASRSLVRWAVVGALAGLVALARGEALGIGLLLVPAAVLAAPGASLRRRGAQCAVALVATAVVVAPWVVRNQTAFHPPILLSSNADSVLAGANCSAVYRGPDIGLWDFACTDYSRRSTLGEARYAHTIGEQGLRYARQHAGRLPLVMAVRVLRGWGLYNPWQQVRVESVESRSVGWGQLGWFVSILTLVLAVPGIVSLRHRRFELVLVAGPAALATLVLALTWGDQRFVLTAVPELAIAAALTLVAAGRRLRRTIGSTVPEPPGGAVREPEDEGVETYEPAPSAVLDAGRVPRARLTGA
ncbi:MAG TPA: glycosyltransferase family 39 protein [Acidimicrobiales bacterium]|nr:glycosyltransferase family 39 protein [Acidimicrobiales bacterium]